MTNVNTTTVAGEDFGLIQTMFARRAALYQTKRDGVDPLGDDQYNYHDVLNHTISAIKTLAHECGVTLPDDPGEGDHNEGRDMRIETFHNVQRASVPQGTSPILNGGLSYTR